MDFEKKIEKLANLYWSEGEDKIKGGGQCYYFFEKIISTKNDKHYADSKKIEDNIYYDTSLMDQQTSIEEMKVYFDDLTIFLGSDELETLTKQCKKLGLVFSIIAEPTLKHIQFTKVNLGKFYESKNPIIVFGYCS